jgi:hypothetical protein
MTNSNFTYGTAKMHQFFVTNEYRSDMISAFSVISWSELSDGNFGCPVGLSIIPAIRQRVGQHDMQ